MSARARSDAADALARALDFLAAGEWQRAHEIVQEQKSGMGSWLHGIVHTLEGDLDNIVLMAMRKEPGRRYQSVEQFSDDLRRYLTGLPVQARADTFTYRAGKFMKRHRAAALAAALVLISLLGGIIATTLAARQARAERERAERMAEQGGEVTIVGQGARLEGTVVSAGSLRIDGQVKGQINAEGDVLLSPQSQVEADIRAQNVVVAGRFKGGINVKGRAELARGGRVEGDITSKTLVVEEGSIFQGQSIMDQQAAQPAGKHASAKSSEPEVQEATV